MDDDFDFTDDEIRDELSKLGYRSIPSERLQEFKKGKLKKKEYQQLKIFPQKALINHHSIRIH